MDELFTLMEAVRLSHSSLAGALYSVLLSTWPYRGLCESHYEIYGGLLVTAL
jgi:hypothetical protein